ncbi:hypothetical protein GCM10011413_03830 [Pedobacter psychrotolerans]|uniref:Uncharacterized protein n=2 Tax=Pedobacter psychrotolerans TaxID=1843235 RepID=A0ABQ1SI65_9SPHI|nr:hypothetical protein GCM10011413_03830 [Pedobacter psychrotolerans]
MIMENEKNKTEESKEKKVGVIPVDDLKGSDADGAYTGDEESPEELAKQQLGTDAETDDKTGKDK